MFFEKLPKKVDHPSSEHKFVEQNIREKASGISQEISSMLKEENKNVDLLREKIDSLKKILGFVSDEKAAEYERLIEGAEASL